jgi:ubiquitin-protein ligase E3 A
MSDSSLTKNELAVKAIEMAKRKAFLEDAGRLEMQTKSPPETKPAPKRNIPFFTSDSLDELVAECQERNDFLPLVRQVGQIFSSSETLNASFLCHGSCIDGGSLEYPDGLTVDVDAVRRAYKILFSLNQGNLQSALINAMVMLSDNICVDIRARRNLDSPNYCNQFIICMENPELQSPEYIESALPQFLSAMTRLPEQQQKKLIQYWSQQSPEQLRLLLACLHQLITVRIVQFDVNSNSYVNDDQGITEAVRTMNMIYIASLLGGLRQGSASLSVLGQPLFPVDLHTNSSSSVAAEASIASSPMQEDVVVYPSLGLLPTVGRKQAQQHNMKVEDCDQLYKMFKRYSWDCRHPLLDHQEFYNDVLDDAIQLDHDFINFKTNEGRFAFLNYPFVLRPATKIMGMFYDCRIRMNRERRHAFFHMLATGNEDIPFLRLVVRRDHMVDDALVQLELVCQDKPHDLKKQLFIQFEDEEGVDEGGIQKEFFQLVIEELFNLDYGTVNV